MFKKQQDDKFKDSLQFYEFVGECEYIDLHDFCYALMDHVPSFSPSLSFSVKNAVIQTSESVMKLSKKSTSGVRMSNYIL